MTENFKHKTHIRVRTFDVDSQGIVHNANYLNYFEIGRVEYRRNLGHRILPTGIFDDGMKVVVVRNEINYRIPARLDDKLEIFTRIEWIKNSSFCFDQLIMNVRNEIVCDGKGILVNLDEKNDSLTISNRFKEEIKIFESNLKLY